MKILSSIFKSNFFIKLRSWEYWPFGIIQLPLFLYFPWLALRAKAFFFFSASNPSILTGGMFGESKFEVLELIPNALKPKTLLQNLPASATDVVINIERSNLKFPLIFKPDLGERGWMVKRINSIADVDQYLLEIKIDFLIQELIEMPLEFGVFYRRYPNEQKGKVISIVEKEMLSVIGDGQSTLKELIFKKDRAILQWQKLRVQHHDRLDEILAPGIKLELVSIGNHSLGTKFLDSSHLITEKLSLSFETISQQVNGFYFGRYDLRAASYDDLAAGNVKIVELNGCGAEPAHIYDPKFSLWKAIWVLIRHWKDIYTISTQNHRRGVPYLSFDEGKRIYNQFKALKS